MHRKQILVSFLLVVLMGCQTQPVSEFDPQRDVITGFVLTLHQRLVITAGTARVYLQHGKVVSANEVSRFYPNCWFEVNDVSDGQQYIEPGKYRVTGVNHYRRPFGLGGIGTVVVASTYAAGFFDRGREIDFITEMRMSSGTPSEIRSFKCKITADPLGKYLTLKDIRAALGSLATFEPGESEAS